MSRVVSVSMSVSDAEWVREYLGSDAASNFEGLASVDTWLVCGTESGVEVIPAVGPASEMPERSGFSMDGTVDEVVSMLEGDGFPIGLYE